MGWWMSDMEPWNTGNCRSLRAFTIVCTSFLVVLDEAKKIGKLANSSCLNHLKHHFHGLNSNLYGCASQHFASFCGSSLWACRFLQTRGSSPPWKPYKEKSWQLDAPKNHQKPQLDAHIQQNFHSHSLAKKSGHVICHMEMASNIIKSPVITTVHSRDIEAIKMSFLSSWRNWPE